MERLNAWLSVTKASCVFAVDVVMLARCEGPWQRCLQAKAATMAESFDRLRRPWFTTPGRPQIYTRNNERAFHFNAILSTNR